MLMQHIGVGYFGYYRATAYAMKHSLMPEIAKLRMKALNFWDKHGIRAAADAFDVSTRTLYWWRRLLRTGGPEALIPRSKAPLVRRSRHWHPDVLKEIRRLRTELPNLGKEQIFVRLKPWCEARHFTCPSTSTIGRIIAGAHDKMRMIPVRLSARGKARLIKKRSVKPRRPKQYRPVKTGELIGMDAIELRMGDLRRYIITMIDEHSDYALALAVPSLNSDITSHFFSKATKLFPVAIRQVVTDNGKEFLGNFDKTLQEASIKHIWTYPYTPKMNATCERFNRTLREQFIEFNELLLFEDLNLFNQRMAEYLVLYNSKRPHKSLELMTPVDYILRESKNCNMWWTHTLLKAAEIPRSTFYYHLKALSKPDKYADVKKRIGEIYHENKGRYGYRRVTLSLHRDGERINHKAVQRLMGTLSLKAAIKVKRYSSYRGEVGQTAPNVLQRDFKATRPNEKWVTDVTEFAVNGRKLYLSPVIDLFNNEVISYSLSERPVMNMVENMLDQAFKKLKPHEHPILHSDQGWQYRMRRYQNILKEQGITQSMSRKGNCLDNAVVECFFGTLKSECFYLDEFSNISELKDAVTEYIDYYNSRRISLKLKGLSPIEYRTQTYVPRV